VSSCFLLLLDRLLGGGEGEAPFLPFPFGLAFCMTAIIEACWCVRLTTVPLDIRKMKEIQNVMNTSHTRLQELFNMKQWLLSSDKIFLSGKSHACCHIPRQMCSLGPHILNDTDQGESVHVMDKVDYRRTSKRYSQTNTELVKLVMRGIRSQTMLAAYYASKTTSDHNEQLSPPKYRLIRIIENSFMRFERITKSCAKEFLCYRRKRQWNENFSSVRYPGLRR
jgi:hypothetical protein